MRNDNGACGLLVDEGEQPGQRVGYGHGADTEKRAERELVLRGDGPAESGDAAQAALCGALCNGALPTEEIEEDDPQNADDAAEQGAEKNCKEGAAGPEERADHGHHFDVAHAHAVALADGGVEGRRSPEEHAADQSAEHGVEYVEKELGLKWEASKTEEEESYSGG